MRAAILWPVAALTPMVPFAIGWYSASIEGLEWYHLYGGFVLLALIGGLAFDSTVRRASTTTNEVK